MKVSLKIILTCLVTAILFLLMVYVNNKAPQWAYKFHEQDYASLVGMDNSEFEQRIRECTYNLIESESWGGKPLVRHQNLWSFLTKKNSISVYEYGEYGLFMHYAYLYAQNKQDDALKVLIKNKFDKGFKESKGETIVRNDQIAYGNIAIDLYNETHDPFYKEFSDKLYLRLDSIEQTEGIILYREGSSEQHVDAIGLVCPFLFYYAQTFQNEHSKEMGERMVKEYIKWGTDDVTGIPVQTYGINSHVKYNHANWGRGISWFLIGTRDMPSPDSLEKARLELLDSTLLSNKRHLYCQYFDQGDIPDMSATIPVLYHLIDKKKMTMSKDELTTLLSPYCDKEGIVRYCSPSIAYPHQSVDCTISSLWGQGLLLYLLSIVE